MSDEQTDTTDVGAQDVGIVNSNRNEVSTEIEEIYTRTSKSGYGKGEGEDFAKYDLATEFETDGIDVRHVGTVRINQYGGYYEVGKKYQLRDKKRVEEAYEQALRYTSPALPSISKIARITKVSRWFVKKVINELEETGWLSNPSKKQKTKSNGVLGFLNIEQELFLLGLRAENPARPVVDYVHNLRVQFGISISTGSISNFFLRRFDKKGNFKKAILVPVDKFTTGNRARYFEFMSKVNMLSDHTRWVFFDEKHLVNKDTLPGKVRANPLTGYVDCIGVSGDFRDSYNLIAAISCNILKPYPMAYSMGRENGTSESFMAFVRRLIVCGWLQHGDVVCLDNSRVHTGGESVALESLLWDHVKDGLPLRILTVFLPTRAPELNPIELVFHILAKRIHSERCKRNSDPCSDEVIRFASEVMDEINIRTIANCYVHCGY